MPASACHHNKTKLVFLFPSEATTVSSPSPVSQDSSALSACNLISSLLQSVAAASLLPT